MLSGAGPCLPGELDVLGRSPEGRLSVTACTKTSFISHLARVPRIIHFSKNKTKKKIRR